MVESSLNMLDVRSRTFERLVLGYMAILGDDGLHSIAQPLVERVVDGESSTVRVRLGYAHKAV